MQACTVAQARSLLRETPASPPNFGNFCYWDSEISMGEQSLFMYFALSLFKILRKNGAFNLTPTLII